MKLRWWILAIVLVTGCIGGCASFGNRNTQLESMQVITPMVLTMYSEDINQYDNGFTSPVAQKITEKTGVKLDIDYPISSVEDKLSIMMAAEDYPDLLMIKNTATLADVGAFIDLEPLIEAYGPNLKALYGDYMNRMRYSKDDPSIYVLPNAPVGAMYQQPSMGVNLQHAVVQELGYPELRTVQDVEAALLAYKEAHPTINGEPTIGLSLLADDWRWQISLFNGAAFVTGVPDDGEWYIDPETYEATYRLLLPEEKEYFRWLNHMYDIGLLDPESFVQKFEAYQAKITSGRVLALIDAKWEYQIAEKELKVNDQTERAYGQYPIQMDNSTKAAEFRDTGYLCGYGIGISVDCEDPITAIKFLDYLASEEGMILRHWGIEGEQYYYDEDGKRTFFDEVVEARTYDPDFCLNTGAGAYVYPFPCYGEGVLDSTGNPYAPETENVDRVIATYSEVEIKVLDAYGAKTWADMYPSSEEVPVSKWGAAWQIPTPDESGISDTLALCNDIAKEALIIAIMSPPEEFDQHWSDMERSLRQAGVYEMNWKFTQVVRERVDYWSGENIK